ADVLASQEYAIGLAVAVHVDTAVCILHDPGRNRRAVPRAQQAVVGGRARPILAVEDNAILVEARVRVHARGVGEISGNLQTPASLGVVRDEAACLRSSFASAVAPFRVGGIAVSESTR